MDRLHQVQRPPFLLPQLSRRGSGSPVVIHTSFQNKVFTAMNTNNFDGARADSGGKIPFHHRPHFRIPCQQSSSFKKPGPRIPMSVNRVKNSIPYKSELCNLFQKGKCFYGENCHYAHKLSEIRQPDLKPVAMVENANERNGMWGGRECYFVASGVVCPYGDRCLYLHKCDERNHSGLNSYRNAGDSIECRSSGGGRNHDKSIFYRKTRLCERWERLGSCHYGMNCTYAHGTEELRQIGYYVELEKGRDSRSMLGSQLSFAGSCRKGTEAATMEGRVPILQYLFIWLLLFLELLITAMLKFQVEQS